MPKAKYSKRITMRSIGFMPEDLEAIALEQKTETPVARILGRVTDIEAGQTQYGPFTKFKGEFAAFNLATGEEIRGQVAILPGPAEMLVDKLVEAAKKQDKNAVAQFGLDVTVREHKSTHDKGWKFTYGVSSLVDTPQEDALSILAAQFGALPMLTDKTSKKKSK